VIYINKNHIEALTFKVTSIGSCGVTLAVVAGAFAELELSLKHEHYFAAVQREKRQGYIKDLESLLSKVAEHKVLHNFSETEWSRVHQIPKRKYREGDDGKYINHDSILEQLLEHYSFNDDDLELIRGVASNLGLIDEGQHVITF
jgi:hypothetical protein